MKTRTRRIVFTIFSLILVLFVFSCSKSEKNTKKSDSVTTSEGALNISLTFPDLNLIKAFKKIAFINEKSGERTSGEYYQKLIEESLYTISIMTERYPTWYPTRIFENMEYSANPIRIDGLPLGITHISIVGYHNGVRRLFGSQTVDVVAGLNKVPVELREVESRDVLVEEEAVAGENQAVNDGGNVDQNDGTGGEEGDIDNGVDVVDDGVVDDENQIVNGNEGEPAIDEGNNGVLEESGDILLTLTPNFAPWIKRVEFNEVLRVGLNRWDVTATICDQEGDAISVVVVGANLRYYYQHLEASEGNCMTIRIANEIEALGTGSESRTLRATDSNGLMTEFIINFIIVEGEEEVDWEVL